jgi:integrase
MRQWRDIEMKRFNKLTTAMVAKAVPGRYGDGLNLWLQVDNNLNRSWVFRYQSDGRAVALGLGPTHSVSLSDARGRARECRRMLLDGIDPLDHKRAKRKQAALARASRMTFTECAHAYVSEHSKTWTSAKHTRQWVSSIERATAAFGAVEVAAIDTDIIVKFLTPIWHKTPESGSRLRGRIEKVLDWAKARKFRDGENPAAWKGALEHLFAAKPKVEHLAALPYAELPKFMQDLRSRDGIGARALEFAILTAARSNEALGARWSEIKDGVWTVPASRMKGNIEHRVPLSTGAVALLDSLPRNGSDLVFPRSSSDQPIHDGSLIDIMHEMRPGYTTHGFRSCFSDWSRERTNFAPDIVERSLAHKIKDKVERAYHRNDNLPKRTRLMQMWSDYCSMPAAAGEVVVLHG